MEYQPDWLRLKDLVNLPSEVSKKKEQTTPKYTEPKPKVGIFRSFLFDNASTELSTPEDTEGKFKEINLLKDKANRYKYLEEIKKFKPLGLYAWGGPGCGKTFLVDLTYDLLETPYKVRMHYNEFMLRIHQKNFYYSNVTINIFFLF
jgi:predicted ATPase